MAEAAMEVVLEADQERFRAMVMVGIFLGCIERPLWPDLALGEATWSMERLDALEEPAKAWLGRMRVEMSKRLKGA